LRLLDLGRIRIGVSELLARFFGVEHPFDPSFGIVTLLFPGSDLRDQFLALADRLSMTTRISSARG